MPSTSSPSPSNRQEINQVFLSGTIQSDLAGRRVGKQQSLIVSFTVETVQHIGLTEQLEVYRWRAKCFGKLAERAQRELRKGIRVTVEGSLSAYKPANKRQPRLQEINLRRFWYEHPMQIGVSMSFNEHTAEERQLQLEEDLES